MLNWSTGRKTYIAAVAGIVGAIAALVAGQITPQVAAQTILGCLLAAFLRSGAAKAEDAAKGK